MSGNVNLTELFNRIWSMVNHTTLFLHNVIDWNIEDPQGKSIEDVRQIRDGIESRVKELVADFSKTKQSFNT